METRHFVAAEVALHCLLLVVSCKAGEWKPSGQTPGLNLQLDDHKFSQKGGNLLV